MRRKLVKGVYLMLLVSLISFFPVDFQGVLSILLASEEEDWAHPENYIFIKEDTTWRKEDDLTFDKAVAIIDGATLTIEKGATVKLGTDGDFWECGYLVVGHGNIIAEGTETEPIVFTDVDDKRFSVEFYENFQESESFFRYVEFRNGGDSQGGGGQVGVRNRNIFQKVNAYAGMPAIYFNSGRLRIENSRFIDSRYVDLKIDMTLDEEYGLNSQVEIVNSNFEKSESDMAVVSEVYCPDDSSLCNDRIKLMNNWYGSSSGPNSEDGKTVQWNNAGSVILDSFRTKELIADPVILIPGIMGSFGVGDNLSLDPILHTYDNLILSLEKNGYTKDINLFEFPYEWRNSNVVSAGYLKNKVNEVKNVSGVSRVDVVAHSMGGLVIRQYIENDSYAQDVDQLITLGTPHRGSPKAYPRWEAGEGFFEPVDVIGKKVFQMEAHVNGYDDLQKYIQERVKSVGELLPDYDYLREASSGEMREYPDNYPRNYFLENLNKTDNVQNLSRVNFINIIGKTDGNTIDKFRVGDSLNEGKWEHGMPENFYDNRTDRGIEYGSGDETVPIESAKGIAANKVIEIDSDHSDLPTKSQCEVIKELTEKIDCDYVSTWDRIKHILSFGVFSPVDIQVIDSQGRRVGKDFETGENLQEIPGSFYSGSDTESEFLTIPNPQDGEYKILTQGTGEGEYRIEAASVKEDEKGEAKEAIVNLTGTAQEGKITEEKPIEVAEGEIMAEEKDEVAPEIEIQSPEDKEYLNNQILNIEYLAKDNVSSGDKIESKVSLDGAALSKSQIDLSLVKLGRHTFEINAKDEAQNESQKEAVFEAITNLGAIQDNVKHYQKLGLIKKKQEAQFILIHLKGAEAISKLIIELEKRRLPEKIKKKLISQLEKAFNLKIEFLIKYLGNTKKIKRGIDLGVRDILIDSLRVIKY